MYSFLHSILADRKGGEIFTLFSPWHFLYIGFAAVAIVTLLLLMRHKSTEQRERLTRSLGFAAFFMYVADFFLMPLAYGEIDIEKLPFHACSFAKNIGIYYLSLSSTKCCEPACAGTYFCKRIGTS